MSEKKYTVFSLSKGNDAYIGLTSNIKNALSVYRQRATNPKADQYNSRHFTRVREIGGYDALSLNIIGEFNTRAEGYDMQMHQLNNTDPSLNTLFKNLDEYRS
jgi:hypothetical protein